ncbi:hypothetical protein BH24ACT14_BH24ACT14_01950 [soil metagenome]
MSIPDISFSREISGPVAERGTAMTCFSTPSMR